MLTPYSRFASRFVHVALDVVVRGTASNASPFYSAR